MCFVVTPEGPSGTGGLLKMCCLTGARACRGMWFVNRKSQGRPEERGPALSGSVAHVLAERSDPQRHGVCRALGLGFNGSYKIEVRLLLLLQQSPLSQITSRSRRCCLVFMCNVLIGSYLSSKLRHLKISGAATKTPAGSASILTWLQRDCSTIWVD